MGKYSNVKKEAKIIPFAQNGDFYFEKGIHAYRKRDLYKARKWLQRATHMKPSDANVISQYAIVLMELGDYQHSNEYFEQILDELEPTMYDCHYFLANNYAFIGLFQEAKKHVEEYLTYEPNGEFVEEAEDLLELLEIDVDEDDTTGTTQDQLIVMQEDARALLEEGKLEEAIDLLLEMIDEYPQFWSGYNNLSLAYFYQGNVQKAMEVSYDVLEKNEGNLHALCNLVVFYYYEGKLKQVKNLIDQLEKVTPILTEHRYKLGATFGMVGRYDLAYTWLRSLQRIGFQGDGTFYYWLSFAAYHTGNETIAFQAWEKVLESNPSKYGSAPWEQDENGLEDEALQLFNTFEVSLQKNVDIKEQLQQGGMPPLVRDFATYAFLHQQHVPLSIQNSYKVALQLNEQMDKSAVKEWFALFVKTVEANMEIKNVDAWASAFTYVYTITQGMKITQTSLANRYGVSVSTLRKHIKAIQSLLS
ncbi:tetratricopeptide repeat protein [Sutcliffiella cohnii]|uniref:tetratricopeptide repeat protein n=1 Tax=Sutcliffiella cohnii TaxID=33932 RepID=UPI002E24E7BF|nr:hypothetical protein [Sutcliffiella cohnii]